MQIKLPTFVKDGALPLSCKTTKDSSYINLFCKLSCSSVRWEEKQASWGRLIMFTDGVFVVVMTIFFPLLASTPVTLFVRTGEQCP